MSQANARQRRGRAGRVRSGVCYHLASSTTFNNLPAHTVPEMLRLGLDEIILQVKHRISAHTVSFIQVHVVLSRSWHWTWETRIPS